MTLPKQVQAQAEAVEQLEKDLGLVEETPAEVVPEAPTPEAPVEPAAEVPPEAPAPEAETPKPVVEDAAWERRFKTLQGKYNAEVPRLHEDLKDLRAQLASLQEQPKPSAPAAEPLVTDKDVETFGGDLLDVIDRKAREVAGKMVGTEMAELRAENQQLREQVEGVTERQVTNTRQTYFAELSRQVPDWEAINVDQNFLDWLGEVDPLSGAQRQAYLDSAFNSGDVSRTAALFNTYKQMTAPPPTPPGKTDAQRELERQVAPGTSKVSVQPQAPAHEKVWSQQEITAFYTDVTKGKYRDNMQEAQRIEQEIDQAVATGRVR